MRSPYTAHARSRKSLTLNGTIIRGLPGSDACDASHSSERHVGRRLLGERPSRARSRAVGGRWNPEAMVEFDNQDLSGSRFRHVDLSGSTFRNIDLSGARLVDVDLVDVEISGWLDNLRINEVDVAPLIEAELDRRHPDRAKMRPTDAAGFREAWAILERLWAGTVERARRLPPELLHERVHDEWSFIETLRHLLFATDAWVLRAFLGRP